MKNSRYITVLACAGSLLLGGCVAMDDIKPQSGTLLNEQLNETTEVLPERADALYSGMYSKLGDPLSFGRFASDRPDDFGFIMMAISNDLEAADISTADNDYNWFSPCMELSSRNADYANPYIRYRGVYDEVSRANDVIRAYGEITEETAPEIRYNVAQAYAIRAFCYLNLAPYYQFNYQYGDNKNLPCVPLVTLETTDFANNPRATVEQVYTQIVNDLTYAIENLEGYTRPDKGKIDQQVAYGLRARAYLDMGKYAEAASDAEKAAAGYTPASKDEVSTPSFYNIDDHNWLWGYDMTLDIAQTFPFATASAWIRSFSSNGYSTGTGTYWRINNILYDKIPASDVRKGWWVDESLTSPLLEGLTWSNSGVTLTGQEIASEEIPDVKMIFTPYTNVKFGMYTIGGSTNEEDWPFMRVEEMLLIQAEGLVKSGNVEAGLKVLNDFVRNYRNPEYNATASGYDGRSLEDEIWFQRRVELWGEGFSNADTRRLNKPLVRFTYKATSNMPEAFQFNLPSNDGWWLLRFCTDELNTNFAIVDNTGGSAPVSGQNAELRDGVTD